MSSNIAKRKREKEKLEFHCEEDWGEERYSNSSNFLIFYKYGKVDLANFSQLSSSPVYHGQCTLSKVDLSYL